MAKKKESKTPNLDKEKKRIGFSTVGEEELRTDEELFWRKRGACILDVLEKFRNNNAKWTDVGRLTELLVQDETRFIGEKPLIQIVKLSSDKFSRERANYTKILGYKVFNLSTDCVMDVASGRESVTRLLCEIGHEMTHSDQDKIAEKIESSKKIDDLTKVTAERILKDYAKEQLPPDIVGGVIQLMKNYLGDEYAKEFENMDPKAFEEKCHEISYSQYLQFSHEINARHRAIAYANDILTSLAEHPNCRPQMRKWLEERHKELGAEIEEEKRKQEDFKFFADFKEHAEKLTKEAFAQIDEQIENFHELNVFKNYGRDENLLKKMEKLYDYLKKVNQETIRISYIDKPFNVLSQDILFSLYNANEEFFSGLVSVLNEREDKQSKGKKAISDAIVEMLLNDDLPSDSFRIQFGNILDDSQKIKLLKGAIKTGRHDILHGFMNVLHYGEISLKTAEFFKETILDLKKQYLKAFKEKDRVICDKLYHGKVSLFISYLISFYRHKNLEIADENFANCLNTQYKKKDVHAFDDEIKNLKEIEKFFDELDKSFFKEIPWKPEDRKKEREFMHKVYGKRYYEKHPTEEPPENDDEESLYRWMFGNLDNPVVKEEPKEEPKEPLLLN